MIISTPILKKSYWTNTWDLKATLGSFWESDQSWPTTLRRMMGLETHLTCWSHSCKLPIVSSVSLNSCKIQHRRNTCSTLILYLAKSPLRQMCMMRCNTWSNRSWMAIMSASSHMGRQAAVRPSLWALIPLGLATQHNKVSSREPSNSFWVRRGKYQSHFKKFTLIQLETF